MITLCVIEGMIEELRLTDAAYHLKRLEDVPPMIKQIYLNRIMEVNLKREAMKSQNKKISHETALKNARFFLKLK